MAGSQPRIPSPLREAAARLMRESDLSMAAIASTTGLSLGTLAAWNRAEGWRPVRRMRREWDASPPRLAALHRLARPRPGPKPAPAGTEPAATAQVAVEHVLTGYEAADIPPLPADLLSLPAGSPSLPADLTTLRTALRAHVGRQIAAFDAALLGEGAAVIDSARVLRDLGGLKRLLDDLSADLLATEGEGDGNQPEPSALDLPGLRAEIARRYGGCRGERPDDGVPGEPAVAAPAGAGA